MSFRSQIESLSHQLLNQEKELQHSSQQLQNAFAMATEEAIKSRAAKEVIKSLTAQLKEWAYRFPWAGGSITSDQACLNTPKDMIINKLANLESSKNQRLHNVKIFKGYRTNTMSAWQPRMFMMWMQIVLSAPIQCQVLLSLNHTIPWILGLVQVLVMLLRVILEEYEAGH